MMWLAGTVLVTTKSLHKCPIRKPRFRRRPDVFFFKTLRKNSFLITTQPHLHSFLPIRIFVTPPRLEPTKWQVITNKRPFRSTMLRYGVTATFSFDPKNVLGKMSFLNMVSVLLNSNVPPLTQPFPKQMTS